MPWTYDLRDLEKYAQNEKELQYLAACKSAKNQDEAAQQLGVTYRTVQRMLQKLRNRRDNAEEGKVLPDDRHIPLGYKPLGYSKMIETEDGKPLWIKMKEDVDVQRENLEAMRAAFLEDIKPEKRLPKLKVKPNPHYLNMFLVTDFHLGMKAWHEETRGNNWDTKIAEDLLVRWFQRAIQQAPAARTALFAQLGDFMHWDGLIPATPLHKNIVDADTRFQYMVRVAIRVFRRVIALLLEHHENVVMLHAEGNHDMASSAWLREAFHALYSEDDRVTVIRDPDPYYCYEHGDVSLFFHHGHLKKQPQIDKAFAYKFREVFGRTKASYGHMGHLHHNKAIETELMEVEQHQTLAATDSYASRHAFGSARSAKIITYDDRYGETWRRTLRPEEV